MTRTRMSIALGVLISFFSAAGVSFAAESALPGDLLYPVKISVNEHVRTSLALQPEVRAHLAAELIQRRIDEAEKLSASATVNKNDTQMLGGELKKNETHALEVIKDLESKGNLQAATSLKAAIERHHAQKQVLEAALEAGNKEGVSAAVNALKENKEEKREDSSRGSLKVNGTGGGTLRINILHNEKSGEAQGTVIQEIGTETKEESEVGSPKDESDEKEHTLFNTRGGLKLQLR